MTTGSLRVRLFGLAVVTIALALGLAWFALTILFERHVKARLGAELGNQILWIAANLHAEDGRAVLSVQPPDPRFTRPFGGLYWQVETEGGTSPLRSRSLWDETLPSPPSNSSVPISYEASGPRNSRVFLRAETLTLPSAEGEWKGHVIVAADHSEIDAPVAGFGRDLAIALMIIGVCLTAAVVAQVGIGLAPLDTLRKEIAAIRARRRSRLDPNVPREVGPLVEELNEMLAAQDEALARARRQAGDLAHGLKTPLMVLSTLARRLEHSGRAKAADEILAQVDTMGRRIDRQLARARLGADHLATTKLGTLIERLVSVMSRTPLGERIEWDIAVDSEATIAADEVDTAEAIGNILENACKWAGRKVRVSSEANREWTAVCVEDDGPGVPDHQLAQVLSSGTRLGDQREGSGLGLAIVNDIVRAYGAELHLLRSPLGGLRVRLNWRQAPERQQTSDDSAVAPFARPGAPAGSSVEAVYVDRHLT